MWCQVEFPPAAMVHGAQVKKHKGGVVEEGSPSFPFKDQWYDLVTVGLYHIHCHNCKEEWGFKLLEPYDDGRMGERFHPIFYNILLVFTS